MPGFHQPKAYSVCSSVRRAAQSGWPRPSVCALLGFLCLWGGHAPLAGAPGTAAGQPAQRLTGHRHFLSVKRWYGRYTLILRADEARAYQRKDPDPESFSGRNRVEYQTTIDVELDERESTDGSLLVGQGWTGRAWGDMRCYVELTSEHRLRADVETVTRKRSLTTGQARFERAKGAGGDSSIQIDVKSGTYDFRVALPGQEMPIKITLTETETVDGKEKRADKLPAVDGVFPGGYSVDPRALKFLALPTPLAPAQMKAQTEGRAATAEAAMQMLQQMTKHRFKLPADGMALAGEETFEYLLDVPQARWPDEEPGAFELCTPPVAVQSQGGPGYRPVQVAAAVPVPIPAPAKVETPLAGQGDTLALRARALPELLPAGLREFSESVRVGRSRTYYYEIEAVSPFGFRSPRSQRGSVRVVGIKGPSAPKAIAAVSEADGGEGSVIGDITFRWAPSPESERVASYHIYWTKAEVVGADTAWVKLSQQPIQLADVPAVDLRALLTLPPRPGAPGAAGTPAADGGAATSPAALAAALSALRRLMRAHRHANPALQPGQTYWYAVEAVDEDGIVSPKSNAVAVSPAKIRARAPAQLSAAAAGTAARVAWVNHELDLKGYLLERGLRRKGWTCASIDVRIYWDWASASRPRARSERHQRLRRSAPPSPLRRLPRRTR